jgi:Ran GTPase-activating protein (RanGAP) involved in mRNA processing and transport
MTSPHCCVETLGLFENSIGVSGAYELSARLEHMHSLRTLDLRYNGIGRRGADSILQSQVRFPSLTALYINDDLANGHAATLAELLGSNACVLQSLHIADNEIGHKGAVLIAESLRCNQTLTHLDISANKVTSRGVEAFAELLSANTSVLMNLNLRSNPHGKRGYDALLIALESCTHLLNIGLCHECEDHLHGCSTCRDDDGENAGDATSGVAKDENDLRGQIRALLRRNKVT